MTSVASRDFFTYQGDAVHLFTLDNGNMQVDITDFGGIWTAARVPDKNGVVKDVLLGHDTEEGILSRKGFLGALVGRCANRIDNGVIHIGENTYQLTVNRPPYHIHGGDEGFDRKVWQAQIIDHQTGQALRLAGKSRDGEEGYPGNMDMQVVYSLGEDNRLSIDYCASADKDTACNMTNHAYFNLAGHDAGPVMNHQLRIDADRFTETDQNSIPTGRMRDVAGTPMDFRRFHAIGERIEEDYDQLKQAGGYDHNFVLNHPTDTLSLFAQAYEPESGRTLIAYTTSPCVQLYTGNGLEGGHPGKDGIVYGRRCGFCLETQYAPNLEHQPEGQSSLLPKGQSFRHTTVFQFGVSSVLPE